MEMRKHERNPRDDENVARKHDNLEYERRNAIDMLNEAHSRNKLSRLYYQSLCAYAVQSKSFNDIHMEPRSSHSRRAWLILRPW
jgi:hypothetical protein